MTGRPAAASAAANRSRQASVHRPTSPEAASVEPSGARIAAPRTSVAIAISRAIATSPSVGVGARAAPFALASGTSATIAAVSLGRASWLTVVGICAIAAVALAISGYTGYSIVVAAVGGSAAINLL